MKTAIKKISVFLRKHTLRAKVVSNSNQIIEHSEFENQLDLFDTTLGFGLDLNTAYHNKNIAYLLASIVSLAVNVSKSFKGDEKRLITKMTSFVKCALNDEPAMALIELIFKNTTPLIEIKRKYDKLLNEQCELKKEIVLLMISTSTLPFFGGVSIPVIILSVLSLFLKFIKYYTIEVKLIAIHPRHAFGKNYNTIELVLMLSIIRTSVLCTKLMEQKLSTQSRHSQRCYYVIKYEYVEYIGNEIYEFNYISIFLYRKLYIFYCRRKV
jgi:hypothetical protein